MNKKPISSTPSTILKDSNSSRNFTTFLSAMLDLKRCSVSPATTRDITNRTAFTTNVSHASVGNLAIKPSLVLIIIDPYLIPLLAIPHKSRRKHHPHQTPLVNLSPLDQRWSRNPNEEISLDLSLFLLWKAKENRERNNNSLKTSLRKSVETPYLTMMMLPIQI